MEPLVCDNCGINVNTERELMDYEDMLVCENCLDKLRRQDEQEYYDMSAYENEEYEY